MARGSNAMARGGPRVSVNFKFSKLLWCNLKVPDVKSGEGTSPNHRLTIVLHRSDEMHWIIFLMIAFMSSRHSVFMLEQIVLTFYFICCFTSPYVTSHGHRDLRYYESIFRGTIFVEFDRNFGIQATCVSLSASSKQLLNFFISSFTVFILISCNFIF